MKRISTIQILFALVLSTMLFFSSCDKLKGEGSNVQYTPDIESFLSLDIDLPCNIEIIYGDSAELTIEAQQNIIDNMYTIVKSQVLYMELTQTVYDHNPITLTFRMPEFRSIYIRDHSNIDVLSEFTKKSNLRFDIIGESELNFPNSITCNDFVFNSTGSSILTMDNLLCTRKFELSCDGKAVLTMAGKTENSILNIDGSLAFHGFDFETTNTSIDVTGTAVPINIQVADQLDINVSGNAQVRYKGDSATLNVTNSIGVLDIEAVE